MLRQQTVREWGQNAGGGGGGSGCLGYFGMDQSFIQE